MQALPYVVVTQEGVAKVYEVCRIIHAHCTTLNECLGPAVALLDCLRQVRSRSPAVMPRNLRARFRRYPQITTMEENDVFCEFVSNLLAEQ